MSLFDELMEMVIDDRPVATLDESVVLAEMNEEIDDMLWGLNESVSDSISKVLDKFNSIGGTNLKKEDLSDINKVKSAVSKMESVKSQNKKMLAKYCVSLFAAILLLFVGSYEATKMDSATFMGFVVDPKQYKSSYAKALAAYIGSLIASFSGMLVRSDYDKLLNAFDKAIRKTEKKIKSEEKKDTTDKSYINELKKTKQALIDGKTEVYNTYKKGLAKANNLNEL